MVKVEGVTWDHRFLIFFKTISNSSKPPPPPPPYNWIYRSEQKMMSHVLQAHVTSVECMCAALLSAIVRCNMKSELNDSFFAFIIFTSWTCLHWMERTSLYKPDSLALNHVIQISTICNGKTPTRVESSTAWSDRQFPQGTFGILFRFMTRVVVWACLHKSMFLPRYVDGCSLLTMVFTTEICHQTFSPHSRWKLKMWCCDFQIF